eukprot:1330813-Pleurochrysis_carterae.AAC.1
MTPFGPSRPPLTHLISTFSLRASLPLFAQTRRYGQHETHRPSTKRRTASNAPPRCMPFLTQSQQRPPRLRRLTQSIRKSLESTSNVG